MNSILKLPSEEFVYSMFCTLSFPKSNEGWATFWRLSDLIYKIILNEFLDAQYNDIWLMDKVSPLKGLFMGFTVYLLNDSLMFNERCLLPEGFASLCTYRTSFLWEFCVAQWELISYWKILHIHYIYEVSPLYESSNV